MVTGELIFLRSQIDQDFGRFMNFFGAVFSRECINHDSHKSLTIIGIIIFAFVSFRYWITRYYYVIFWSNTFQRCKKRLAKNNFKIFCADYIQNDKNLMILTLSRLSSGGWLLHQSDRLGFRAHIFDEKSDKFVCAWMSYIKFGNLSGTIRSTFFVLISYYTFSREYLVGDSLLLSFNISKRQKGLQAFLRCRSDRTLSIFSIRERYLEWDCILAHSAAKCIGSRH